MQLNFSNIDAIITSQTDPEAFSGVAHITQGEQVVFAQGYGDANRAESIPNRVNTRFQTASGCKIFTSVAICQLIERGQLNLETPLLECVDVTFPHYDPGITIRHLLTHSSGIFSYFEEDVDDDYEALWRDLPVYQVRSPRDFLPLFQDKAMKFPPGERFEYNDGGFILLGLVLEAVSEMDFSLYIQENIFAPAAMHSSGYFASDQLPERTAYAYIQNEDGSWRTNIFAVPVIGGADGGAYTTAPDMFNFWQALRGHQILGEEMTRELISPQISVPENEAAGTHYGYGVWIDQPEGALRKFGVEGFDPGVAMRSAVFPEGDLTFTMIGNTSRALWRIYRQIEARFILKP